MSVPPARRLPRPRLIARLTAALLAFAPVFARANGTRLPNQDAEATARGNAFAATADNPSAIYYNPAGLTQLPGLQVLAESYSILTQENYTPAGGSTVGARRTVAVVPQFYASYTPASSPLSYGLGVYSPFGQSSDWPDNSGFSTAATYNEITYLTMAPTIAWKISDHLSLGAGLQINHVKTNLGRALYAGSPNDFIYKGDDTSFGYNLGLLWKITDHHVLGLNYQSRSTSRFTGTESGGPFGSAPASLNLPFPDVITLGYSWRPTPDWNIEVSVDRTNWDLLNNVTLSSPSAPAPLPTTTTIPFNWKASYYYELGVTRYLPDGWRVSAGYCYSENSTPDSSFNPAVPDSARQLLSAGFGRTFGAVSCYLTYQHGLKNSRTVTGAPALTAPQTADGLYENSLDAIALSFRYAF